MKTPICQYCGAQKGWLLGPRDFMFICPECSRFVDGNKLWWPGQMYVMCSKCQFAWLQVDYQTWGPTDEYVCPTCYKNLEAIEHQLTTFEVNGYIRLSHVLYVKATDEAAAVELAEQYILEQGIDYNDCDLEGHDYTARLPNTPVAAGWIVASQEKCENCGQYACTCPDV